MFRFQTKSKSSKLEISLPDDYVNQEIEISIISQKELNVKKEEDLFDLSENEENQTSNLSPNKAYEILGVDPIKIYIAKNLIPLAETLIKDISSLRESFVWQFGYILNTVRICDSLSLKNNEYQILINDSPAVSGKVPSDNFSDSSKQIISELQEAVFNDIDKLLTLAEIEKMLGAIENQNPTLHEFFHLWIDINRETRIRIKFFLNIVQKVFCNLLKEKISIRNIVYILEQIQTLTLSELRGTDIGVSDLISEIIRPNLARQISEQNVWEKGKKEIKAILLKPELEEELEKSLKRINNEFVLVIDSERTKLICSKILEVINKVYKETGKRPAIITGQPIRLPLFRLLFFFDKKIKVISNREILIPEYEITVLETISGETL